MLNEKEYNNLKSRIVKAVDDVLKDFLEKKDNSVLKEKIYTNGIMLSPNGEILCRISDNKIKWYLKKNLAEKVSDDPPTIKLKFEPKGKGHINDKFYLQEKENKCVVCGSIENLSKHHVVPQCFRKFFPDNLKNHSYHDVLLMCRKCHDEYEVFADILKRDISKEHNIPVQGYGTLNNNLVKKAKKSANILLRDKNISEKRKNKLKNILIFYFNKKNIFKSDIINASKINMNTEIKEPVEFGKFVVEHLSSLEEFTIKWRKHFIEKMSPKHLPEFWDINRKI